MENLEKIEEQQEKVEALFNSTESWEDLKEMIDDLKPEEDAEKDEKHIKAIREGKFEDEERKDDLPMTRLLSREGGLRDKANELLIGDAKNWKDLLGKILQIGELESTSGTTYSKAELWDQIEEAQKTGDPSGVTNTAGLRLKVKSFIVADTIQ